MLCYNEQFRERENTMALTWTVDNLHITVYDDKNLLGEAGAELASQHINEAIEAKGHAVIVLATGASQFEFLDHLSGQVLKWARVEAFHLDEYVGLPATHPASFRRYLQERLLNKVDIRTFHAIIGDADDVQAECDRLDTLYRNKEIDVAFVGIGENGHLAFNDPPATFNDRVMYKIVQLDTACRRQQMGEGWFKSLDDVPEQAISMTIPGIMRAKTIICSVPDLRKAQAVYNTLKGKISGEYPASILRRHPRAYLLLDPNSASKLT